MRNITNILGLMIAVSMFSCFLPKPTFVTTQGFNVYCTQGACLDKADVDLGIEIVIDELVAKLPAIYSRDRIEEILAAQYQWHSIYLLPFQEGPPGSCAVEGAPLRKCKGIPCDKGTSGWCAGRLEINQNFGFEDIEMWLPLFSDCAAYNSLSHEMIHAITYLVRKTVDYNHSEVPYWPRACLSTYPLDTPERTECIQNSIKHAAHWKFCEQVCSDICN